MIAMHIIGWYTFIHDDINRRLYICMAIIGDITVHIYLNGDKQKLRFFILQIPENSLNFKGKIVLHFVPSMFRYNMVYILPANTQFKFKKKF